MTADRPVWLPPLADLHAEDSRELDIDADGMAGLIDMHNDFASYDEAEAYLRRAVDFYRDRLLTHFFAQQLRKARHLEGFDPPCR